MIEHQAEQGVDYMTIHAGVLLEHLPLVQHRITGHRLARRPLIAQWMLHHQKQNPLYTHCDELLEICAQVRRDDLASATACGRAASPTPATPRSSRS